MHKHFIIINSKHRGDRYFLFLFLAPKKKKAKKTDKAETYDELVERKKESAKEIEALEAQLEQRKQEGKV